MRRKLARWTIVTLVAASSVMPLCGCKTFGSSSSSNKSWFAWGGKKKSDRPAALAQNTQPAKPSYPPPVVPQQGSVAGGGYPATATPAAAWQPQQPAGGSNPYSHSPNPYGGGNVVTQPSNAYPPAGGGYSPAPSPYGAPPAQGYGSQYTSQPANQADPRTATNPGYPGYGSGASATPSQYNATGASGYSNGGYSNNQQPSYDNRAGATPDYSNATPPRFSADNSANGGYGSSYSNPAASTGDASGYRPGSTNTGFPTQPAAYDTNYSPAASGNAYPPTYSPQGNQPAGSYSPPTRTY